MWQIRGNEPLAAKKVYTDDRILLDGWDQKRQADPKDSDPYNPPCGNYFESTYKRMGTMREELGTTETHDMLEQIWTKAEYEARYPRKMLINFLCYEATESPARHKQLLKSGIDQYPPGYFTADYRTTMQRDYTPTVPRIQEPIRLPEVAFLQNRRCLSELTDSMSVSRHGSYKFLDDEKGQFQTARGLRLGRYASYDPAKGTHVVGNCPWPPANGKPGPVTEDRADRQ